MKTNPWTYKIKHLNREKIIGSFYERELLLSILQKSCYPEPYSHIRDKVKVVLELSNCAIKKELEHTKGIVRSDLASKNCFIALKAEVGKLDINKLTNFPTILNNLETKEEDLDVGKLRTVPVDLKKSGDV